MANEKRAQKKEQIIYTAIKMLEQSSYNDVRIAVSYTHLTLPTIA